MSRRSVVAVSVFMLAAMPSLAFGQDALPRAVRLQLEQLQATSSPALRPVVRSGRLSWLGGLREPVAGELPSAMAADFVNRHEPLLGVTPEMTLAVSQIATFRHRTYVHLGVTVAGMPVLGTQVVISLRDGQVRHVSSNVRPLAPVSIDRPLIDAETASRAVADASGRPARIPAEMAWLPMGEELVPVWVVEQGEADPPRDWRYLVEARTGVVLSRFDQFMRSDGYVYLPNPEVAGGVEEYTQVELPDLNSSIVLSGSRARSFQCVGMPEGDCESWDVPCRQCGLREHYATGDADGNFLYFPMEPDLDDEFAEVQAYYHVTVFSEWLEDTFGYQHRCNGATAVDAHVNYHIAGDPYTSANAFYGDVDGDGCGDVTLGEGLGVDFAYDGDVIYHEFGHGVVESAGGLGCYPMGVCYDDLGPDWTALGLNEGYADFLSVAFTDDPDLGEHAGGAFESGEALIRSASNDHLCPFDLVGESHYDAQIWTGTGWDIREAIGPELSDQLFYATLLSLGMDAGYADAAAALLDAADELVDDGDMTDEEHEELQAILGPDGRRIDGCERIIPLDQIPDGHGEEFLLLYTWRGTDPQPAGLQWSITAPRRANRLRFWVEEDHYGADSIVLHIRKNEPVGVSTTFDMSTHRRTTEYTEDYSVTLDDELELTPETDPPLEEDTTYYFAMGFVCSNGCLLRPRGEVHQAPGYDPISDAGPDQEVMVGDTVQLDGSASYDPDGDELTFSWEVTGATAVELEGADGPTPSFVATEPGDVAVSLTVTDYDGQDDTDRVVIRVSEPASDGGPDGGTDGGTDNGGDDGGCSCRVARNHQPSLATILSSLVP